MKIDKQLLENLRQKAQESERLRMNFDLRTTAEDGSQRMLNSLEPGTVLPIHRHMKSTETVILIKGTVRQNYYNDAGEVVESFVASDKGPIYGFSVPVGQWHNTKCLEAGTVFFESKDGAYEPLPPEDVMTLKSNK